MDMFVIPVYVLRLNLYGQKLAGLLWAKHCEMQGTKAGFQKVQARECLYKKVVTEQILSVFVDDFKMVAKSADHDMPWGELKGVIDMGEEEPESRFLGCIYTNFTCTAAQVEDMLKQHPS